MKKLLFFALLMALVACKPKQILSTSTEQVRFVEVATERKDTILPGFTIRTQFSIPEIIEREVHDTLRITNPETEAELLIWKDNYGNLVAQCDDKDQVIEKLRESLVEKSSETKSTVVEKDPRSWWEKLTQLIPWYAYLLAGLIAGLILRR